MLRSKQTSSLRSDTPSLKSSIDNSVHWTNSLQETLISVVPEGLDGIEVSGGAENGQFCWIKNINPDKINYHSGLLHANDVILEVQGQKVAGYTLHDLQEWLRLITNNSNPIMLKAVPAGLLTKDLKEFLNTRFQKASVDHDLQQTVRINIYRRTVPCTTRQPRPGEVDEVDYKFLSPEEFSNLEKSGCLLESGAFDGNFYGTPKPPKLSGPDSPFRRSGSAGNIAPGQHPSSDGKRRRNRSNIEISLPNVSDGILAQQKKSVERAHSSLGVQASQEAAIFDGKRHFMDNNSAPGQWVNSKVNNAGRMQQNDLPHGWEKIDDPEFGTYYIDHIDKKTQYEHPSMPSQQWSKDGDQLDSPSSGLHSDRSSDREQKRAFNSKYPPSYGAQQRYLFTRNPEELEGNFVMTELVKSARGLGFTIIGGDDTTEEFLQIKSIAPNGPAFNDGKLQRSDVLVYVNDQCVLGYSHQEVINLFQSIPVGDRVTLEICRGYPLPFDPDDPNNEIITTVAVTLPSSVMPGANLSVSEHSHGRKLATPVEIAKSKSSEENSTSEDTLTLQTGLQSEILRIGIVRGPMGFGFTIADSDYGQKVRQILDRPRCKNLQEGDILLEINGITVKDLEHLDVVQVLKNCPMGNEAVVVVQRGGVPLKSRKKKATLRHQPSKAADVNGTQASRWNGDALPRQSSFPDNSDGDADENGSMPPDLTLRQPDLPLAACTDPEQPEKDIEAENSNLTIGITADDEMKLASVQVMVDNDEDAPMRSRMPAADQKLLHGASTQWSSQSYADNRGNLATETNAGYTDARNENDFINNRIPAYGIHDSQNSEYNHGLPGDVPSRREFINQMSFSEYDKKPVIRSHARSKTPGPVLMRSRPELENNDEFYSRRLAQEARSKTPFRDLHTRPIKPMSGTPDFIPASKYQTSPSSGIRQPTHADFNNRSNDGFQEPFQAQRATSNFPPPSVGVSAAHMQGIPALYNRSMTPSSRQPDSLPLSGSTSFENVNPVASAVLPSKDGWRSELPGAGPSGGWPSGRYPPDQFQEFSVYLVRQEQGFGFRIIGGTEEGSQVSVGHIVPGGAADVDGLLQPNDEIIYINGLCVIGASHHKVVQLMGHASGVGQVTLRVRRRGRPAGEPIMPTLKRPTVNYPYDVTLTRQEYEGFGFVIVSSVTRSGSVIGKLIENSPAQRCSQLEVGDHILAVNHTSILHMPHDEVVNLIKESGRTVTLTVGPPENSSSTSSLIQRFSNIPSTGFGSGGFSSRSESDASQRPEYSPLHDSLGPMPADAPIYSYTEPQRVLHSKQSSNPATSDDKFYSIDLNRGSRGFGFSIRGGKEFNNMPLFILKIADGGAAQVDGRLKVGDQIIEINGHNTNSMTHADAIDLIQSGASIRLLVKRITAPQLFGGSRPSPNLFNGVVQSKASDFPPSALHTLPTNPSNERPDSSYVYSQVSNISGRQQAIYR